MPYEASLIEISDLKKFFPVRKGFIQNILSKEQQYVKAVDGISFEIKRGEIYGLAGESGCGKTTTGRLLLNLLAPSGGTVLFEDVDIFNLDTRRMKEFRRKAQIIFQDPYESLNPRMNIFEFVSEPLTVHKIGNVEELLRDSLERVELVPPEEYLYRFPHELSGGQRQRVAIARAIILNPKFIVADEPVSMLDVSIRSSILNVLKNLRDELNISCLYITHDLATAKQICDRISIMYLGKIVEESLIDEIFKQPLHPYTQALIAAAPEPDPEAEKSKVILKGEIPSPTNIPSGCRFHTRCLYAEEICWTKEPELVKIAEGRRVACHFVKNFT